MKVTLNDQDQEKLNTIEVINFVLSNINKKVTFISEKVTK